MNTARALAAIVIALLSGAVGYWIGVTQSVAAQVPPGAAVMPYYGWHWGMGFGFLGLLFPILFFFLLFGLLRAAFWGWGGRPYGHRERLEEIHRELHRERGSDASST